MGIGKLLNSLTINKEDVIKSAEKLKEGLDDASKSVKNKAVSSTSDVSSYLSTRKDTLKESLFQAKDNVSNVLDKTISAKNKKFDEIAEFHLKVQKLYSSVQEVINKLESDKAFFNYIIALSAIGMAVANVDGEISEEEEIEINEFVGGIASSYYPEHVKETIQNLKDNPPTFNEAKLYLEKVDAKNYGSIRDLIDVIILADDTVEEEEKAFLIAFDSYIEEVSQTTAVKLLKE